MMASTKSEGQDKNRNIYDFLMTLWIFGIALFLLPSIIFSYFGKEHFCNYYYFLNLAKIYMHYHFLFETIRIIKENFI